MKFANFESKNKGFTLIEILVVVTIISILAGVVTYSSLASSQKSRDSKRQGDLRLLQTAIELYKNKNGRYPEGCNGSGNWSGQQGTDYACPAGSNQYIIGLAPEYIPVLPQEKKLNGAQSGYAYISNRDNTLSPSDGTVYKVMAMNTVESELLNNESAYLHPFKSCDMRARDNYDGSFTVLAASSWCNSTARSLASNPIIASNASISHCKFPSTRFQQSYGVWGGFAPCTGSCVIVAGAGANTVEANTEQIICR